jgi:CheY-like chemotaxis protein
MTPLRELNCILLIDDDIPTNFIHRKVIEKSKIEAHVQVAASAKEGLDFLTYAGKYAGSENVPRPGIIFLDINMPGMNGWDFMDVYRELDQAQKNRIAVIMLTTSLNLDDRERALQDEDIVTFIHKPLRPETVVELVEAYFPKAG